MCFDFIGKEKAWLRNLELMKTEVMPRLQRLLN
jgi:hypothetical protein